MIQQSRAAAAATKDQHITNYSGKLLFIQKQTQQHVNLLLINYYKHTTLTQIFV